MLSERSSHSAWPGGAARQPLWAAPWRREAAAWAGLQSGAPRWKYTVSTTRLHPCIVSRRRARFSHSPARGGVGGAGLRGQALRPVGPRTSVAAQSSLQSAGLSRLGMWNKVPGRLGPEHLAPAIPPPPTPNVGSEQQPFLQPFGGGLGDVSEFWEDPGWDLERAPAGLAGGYEVVVKGQSESRSAPHTQTRRAPFSTAGLIHQGLEGECLCASRCEGRGGEMSGDLRPAAPKAFWS